jgi:LuxR family maltose regulon positive regulatory protein
MMAINTGKAASTAAPMSISLLQTKLYVPALPPNERLVSRPRLIARLNGGLQSSCKLVLISAPAGFGKTTLASAWVASLTSQGLTPAWVLLDEQDNDPVRFWSYVISALEMVHADIGARAAALLRATPAPQAAISRSWAEQLRAVLTALINDLTTQRSAHAPATPVLLVLDDYHTIDNQTIHDSLAYLLDYMPDHMHLVILTRADPPLPLARLRARDQLLELRSIDLRFDADQVNTFLNQVMQLALPADAVAALDTRTEGWPAGLHLAALSMQGMAPGQAGRFIATFSGTDRNVLSFLGEEVLQRQPPELQTFLLHTSVLPYLSAPLCADVTGKRDSQRILEKLAGDNLFTTRLDGEGRWFRYHPLFAEALRARLEQVQAELLPLLHRRAAAWYQREGALADAINHTLAAGDQEHAARLVEGAYKRLVMRGELVTLRNWLGALPDDLVRTRAKLCVASALALSYSGRFQQVEAFLQAAEAALPGGGTDAPELVRGEIAALRAVLASLRWDTRQALALSDQALSLLPPSKAGEVLWLEVIIRQAQGNAHRLRGEVRQAARAYAAALNGAEALDSPFLALAVTNRLGQVHNAQGRLHQAASIFERVLRQVTDQGGELLWFAGELSVNLGEIYREWNDLATALDHVRRGIELSQQAGNNVGRLAGHQALASVLAARGAWDTAWLEIAAAERLALGSGAPHVGRQVAAFRAQLSLMQGGPTMPDDAAAWAEQHFPQRGQSSIGDEPSVLHEFEALTLARLRLVQRQPDAALRLAGEVQTAAEPDGRMRTVLQALMLQALAQQMLGERLAALETLRRALILGEPERYTRLFVDEGASMQALLAEWRRHPTVLPGQPREGLLRYTERLLAAFADHTTATGASPTVQPLQSETLTPRELEILRLMAGGASNREMAEHLVVTVGTVKGHIHHILGKLEARNRTEAVARARERGLLQT